MATNFPASLDSLTNPTSSDSLNSPSHSAQHANVNDAVEALQAKVGADSSAVTSSLDYKVAQLEAISHGKILQVVSTTKSDTFSSSLASGASTAITGLSASITPSSTASKILVSVDASGSMATYAAIGFIVKRDGTAIGVGDTAGSRISVSSAAAAWIADSSCIMAASSQHLDSPASTSALSYTVEAVNLMATTQTVYINRTTADTNQANFPRAVSTITLMEVSA